MSVKQGTSVAHAGQPCKHYLPCFESSSILGTNKQQPKAQARTFLTKTCLHMAFPVSSHLGDRGTWAGNPRLPTCNSHFPSRGAEGMLTFMQGLGYGAGITLWASSSKRGFTCALRALQA